MKSRILRRSSLLVPTLVGAAMSIAIPNTARAAAANGGQPLPWEGPLNQVLASFTGPGGKGAVHPGHRGHRIWFRVQRRRWAAAHPRPAAGRVHRGHGHQLRRDVLRLRRRRRLVGNGMPALRKVGATMTRPEEIEGYEVPLHVALTQPILMGGAPRTFAILNGTRRPGRRNGLAPVVAWIPGRCGSAHDARC